MVEYDFLKRHSLFGGITSAECDLIQPLFKEIDYDPGDTIIQEGAVNDRVFFICRGSVEILKNVGRDAAHADSHRIATLSEGDTFGEMELIDVQRCAASVRALEPVRALTLSHRDLYQVSKKNLKTYTLIIMNLAREISRRLRRMDDMWAAAHIGGDEIPSA